MANKEIFIISVIMLIAEIPAIYNSNILTTQEC